MGLIEDYSLQKWVSLRLLEKRIQLPLDADAHLVDLRAEKPDVAFVCLHGAGGEDDCSTCAFGFYFRMWAQGLHLVGQPGTKHAVVCARPGQRRSPRSFGLLRLC